MEGLVKFFLVLSIKLLGRVVASTDSITSLDGKSVVVTSCTSVFGTSVEVVLTTSSDIDVRDVLLRFGDEAVIV